MEKSNPVADIEEVEVKESFEMNDLKTLRSPNNTKIIPTKNIKKQLSLTPESSRNDQKNKMGDEDCGSNSLCLNNESIGKKYINRQSENTVIDDFIEAQKGLTGTPELVKNFRQRRIIFSEDQLKTQAVFVLGVSNDEKLQKKGISPIECKRRVVKLLEDVDPDQKQEAVDLLMDYLSYHFCTDGRIKTSSNQNGHSYKLDNLNRVIEKGLVNDNIHKEELNADEKLDRSPIKSENVKSTKRKYVTSFKVKKNKRIQELWQRFTEIDLKIKQLHVQQVQVSNISFVETTLLENTQTIQKQLNRLHEERLEIGKTFQEILNLPSPVHSLRVDSSKKNPYLLAEYLNPITNRSTTKSLGSII